MRRHVTRMTRNVRDLCRWDASTGKAVDTSDRKPLAIGHDGDRGWLVVRGSALIWVKAARGAAPQPCLPGDLVFVEDQVLVYGDRYAAAEHAGVVYLEHHAGSEAPPPRPRVPQPGDLVYPINRTITLASAGDTETLVDSLYLAAFAGFPLHLRAQLKSQTTAGNPSFQVGARAPAELRYRVVADAATDVTHSRVWMFPGDADAETQVVADLPGLPSASGVDVAAGQRWLLDVYSVDTGGTSSAPDDLEVTIVGGIYVGSADDFCETRWQMRRNAGAVSQYHTLCSVFASPGPNHEGDTAERRVFLANFQPTAQAVYLARVYVDSLHGGPWVANGFTTLGNVTAGAANGSGIAYAGTLPHLYLEVYADAAEAVGGNVVFLGVI